MSTMYSNTLKIMGNNEQVKEVRNFLIGGPEEAKPELYIDFNKILKMPSEKGIEPVNYNTDLVHLLLFEKHTFRSGNILQEAHEEFIKLDIKIQEDSILRALKHQRNIIKFGWGYEFDWMLQNWGTIWTEEWEQELVAENEIIFLTRRIDPGHIIGIVSEKFPKIALELEIAGDDGVYYKVVFLNGEYKLIEKDEHQF